MRDLIKISNEIRAKGLKTQEAASIYQISPQWVSRLKFIAKADPETKRILATKTKTYVKNIVDEVRSKNRGRTNATKLAKLKSAIFLKKIYRKSNAETGQGDKQKLKNVLSRLTEELISHRETKIKLQTISKQNSKLQEMNARILSKLNFLPKNTLEKDPNYMYIESILQSKFGVRVDISGTKITLDCMTTEILEGVIEKLNK